MQRPVDEVALDLAKLLGDGRRPGQRAAGVILPQPSALECLLEPEPTWFDRALKAGLVVICVAAVSFWACGDALEPRDVNPPRPGAAALPSDAELAAVEQRDRDLECMRCWLDGFSRDLRTMPQEARR